MMKSRKLLLVVAFITALTFTLSTSSVSSIAADRGVEVTVTEDDQAYLGFEQNATRVDNGTTTLEVTVRNQYPTRTTLSTVVVTSNGTTVDLAEDDQLESGTSRTHTFDSVSCDETITVAASGSRVDVYFERAVSCN